MTASNKETVRVLVIDDDESIHDAYRLSLVPQRTVSDARSVEVRELEDALFGDLDTDSVPQDNASQPEIELVHAFQGKEGVEEAQAALVQGQPFSVALVDFRMPPGWDGVETIRHLWNIDPEVRVVLCTAYSDIGQEDIFAELGQHDQLWFMRKPFWSQQISDLVYSLYEHWQQRGQVERNVG